MSLIINKVSSCSTQVNYFYFESDAVFSYDIIGTYKVDFADITFTNNDGILLSGIEALREAYQRRNLVARIGADEFTNGRFISQSFEQSFLVGSSSCSIIIEESKRLDDYSSHEFAQYIPSPQWLSSFQENFTFSRSGDNYTSTRNTSIAYKQDVGDQFLNKTKQFLTDTYFDNRPNLGYQVDGISENGRFNGDFRPLISETIDLINLSVTLQETLQTSFIDEDHSRQQTYSIDIGEDGYTTKRYNVVIKAIKENLEEVAFDACKSILEEIITANQTEFDSPIEIGKGINRDGGLITLNVSFSNNPKFNGLFSYTATKQKSANQKLHDYLISAEITAEGRNTAEKIGNLKENYITFSSLYEGKINTLFGSVTVFEKSRDITFSSKEPKISESIVYTQDTSYDQEGNILKEELTLSTTLPTTRNRIFVSPSTNGEVVEKANGLSSAGSVSYNYNVVSKMSSKIGGLIGYLESIPDINGFLSSDSITANLECSGSRVITLIIDEE